MKVKTKSKAIVKSGPGRPAANPDITRLPAHGGSPEGDRSQVLWKRLEKRVPAVRILRALDSVSDERFSRMAEDMISCMDGGREHLGLRTLAKRHSITYTELVSALVKRGLGDGLVELSEDLPYIMRDLGRDARHTLIACPRCDGKGQEAVGEETSLPCSKCKGKGKVVRRASDTARKFVLDGVGFTSRAGAPLQVNINQAFNSISKDADVSLETLIRETDRAIETTSDVVDA